MSLSTGARLGPYEIVALIGAGGMGEVYRARDAKLDRDVAIKLLSESVAADPERLARFEREAKTLAALNHPHIGHIYGFEDSTGTPALVMELVEGPTLADRIAKGSIPINEALAIAIQIADALDSAHQHHVIHRDLKPDNIKIAHDGRVKVLDFGLAKLAERPGELSTDGLGLADTRSAHATRVGVVLGTAAYMSPEQATGSPVDQRTDMFAFGCVLFEMLTGRRAFTGDSLAQITSNVLTRYPDWSLLPSSLPPRLRDLLESCLEKNSKKRRRDAGDVRGELERTLATLDGRQDSATQAPRRARGWIFAAAAIVTATATLTLGATWRASPAKPEMRVEITTPRTLRTHEFALSPDGASLVVAAAGGVWLRRLDETNGRTIPGTQGGGMPFWSPDSRSIAFFAAGALQRVDLTGAMLQTLARVTNVARGGSWGTNGTILFATDGSPILSVPSTGGEVRALTQIGRGETAHRFPQFLADGKHFLYYVVGIREVQGIYLASLDGGAAKRIAAADSAAVPAGPDSIVFNTQGVLTLQQLDVERGVLSGPSQTIAESMQIQVFRMAGVSVARNGTIAYRRYSGDRRVLNWYDRRGLLVGSVGEPERNQLRTARLSPDGRRVAIDITTEGNRDVWLRDLATGILSRFTTDSGLDGFPMWSPDGRQIAFESDRGGSYHIYVKSTANVDDEKIVLQASGSQWPLAWSRDGHFLLYYDSANSGDLWALPMTGTDRTAIPVARSAASESDGVFSPDGRWVAYVTNESGRDQIVVQPFPTPTAKWYVSAGGGIGPCWSADGAELYFVAPDGTIMAVPVQRSIDTFRHGAPTALFRSRIINTGIGTNRAEFDVSADGRFLINEALDEPQDPLVLLLNRKSIR